MLRSLNLVAILAAATVCTPSHAGASSALPDDAPLLFVVRGNATARGGELRIRADRLEWFTDRPQHSAGTISTRSFQDHWSEWGFAELAPNAAIPGKDLDAVVELSEPRARREAITFRMSPVRGKVPDGRLGTISVFVDGTADTGIQRVLADPNPSSYNQPVVITVWVNCDIPSSDSPEILFYDGTQSFDLGSAPVVDGVATFTYSFLYGGTHEIAMFLTGTGTCLNTSEYYEQDVE